MLSQFHRPFSVEIMFLSISWFAFVAPFFRSTLTPQQKKEVSIFDGIHIFVYIWVRAATIGVKYGYYGHRDYYGDVSIGTKTYRESKRLLKNLYAI